MSLTPHKLNLDAMKKEFKRMKSRFDGKMCVFMSVFMLRVIQFITLLIIENDEAKGLRLETFFHILSCSICFGKL